MLCHLLGHLSDAKREVTILLDAKLCVTILYECTYIDKHPVETRRYGMGAFTKNSDNCVNANGVTRPTKRLLELLSDRIHCQRYRAAAG